MELGFEKLKVWQKSINFVTEVYSLTKEFPPDERFGLTAQIRRATISIASNIAEGSARRTVKERARFYEIAFSSGIEILNS